MTGWQVLSGQGCVLRHKDRTLRTARASQPDDHYLAYPLSDVPILAWMAPVNPQDYLSLVDPDGTHHPV